MSTTVRRGLAGLLSILLVALVTYQGPVQADETDGGFSVDDFAGNSIGTRTLVGGPHDQCGWTDNHTMTMGTGTMKIDLRVPDTRGCTYASIGVRWTAPTSVNIEQGGADRIILKYRDVKPEVPSAVVFGLELVDVNGRTASVGGLSRNGGPAGDFLTIRYAPEYEGDVSYLTFQSGFDKSRVKSITLNISATASNTNVSVTFEGIGTNVGEPAYVAPSFSTAAAYEFPANTNTTHSFTVTGTPAPDVSWTGKPAWMTITTSATTSGRQVTMSGNPGTAYADHSLAFHADVANSLTADAAVRAVVPSPVTATTTTGDRLVGQAGPFVVGSVSSTPASTSLTNPSAIPPGTALEISGTSIVLTGTPTTPGTYAMSATVGNEFRTALFERTIVIGAVPHITAPATQYVVRGESMAPFTPTVTGYPEPTVSITGLPDGLSATDGVITGVPSATGTHTATISADNAFGSDETTFDIAVGDRPTLDAVSALAVTAGTPADVHMTTTGNPTSITVTGLPAGLAATLSAGVVEVIGTPQRPASAAATSGTASISVSNAFGSTSHDVPWTVSANPVITGSTTAASRVGTALTPVDITIVGYPTPTVTVTDPDADGALLPPGITFDDSVAGVVTFTGSPTAPGTETVRITADNGVGGPVTHDITVTALTTPAFTDTTPHLVVAQGSTATLTIEATGVPTPTLTMGSAPSWLTFDATTGTVMANPDMSVSGYYGPYQIDATNGAGSTSVDLFVDVTAAPDITLSAPVSLPLGATVNEPVATLGGHPLPQVTASGLPAGLSLAQTGSTVSVVGIPTGPAGTYTAELTASNRVGEPVTVNLPITITAPPTISAPASAVFIMGEPASLTPTVGGSPLPTVTVTGLPHGMTFDSATGEISGRPDASGTYTVTFTTVGGAAGSSPASVTVSVLVAVAPLFVVVPTDTTYTVGAPPSTISIIPFGYPTPTTTVSGLPAGLTASWDGFSLSISGTPTVGGVYPVTVTAENEAGSVSAEWVITANEAPTLSAPSSVTALQGQPITPIPITATGYPAPTVDVLAMPPGLSLQSDGGVLSIVGTPTSVGLTPAIVTATNRLGTATRTIAFDVGAVPVLGPDKTVTFQAGLTTVHDVELTGDPLAAVVTSTLPSWLTFDATTLQFTASPVAADAGATGMVVVNAAGRFGSDLMTLTYAVTLPPGMSVASGTRAMNSGTAVTETLATVTGYPTPSVSASGLPTGLSLDIVGGTLVLSGSTADAGSHDVTVTLSNGVGSNAVSQWTIDVYEAAGLSVPTDRTLTIGAPVSLPITASGYPVPMITVSGLPQGLTWTPSPGGGVISGSPTAAEVATVTVSASNSAGQDAVRQFTLTTALAVITVDSGSSDVPAGSQVSVSASGFQPGEKVAIELHSTPVLLANVVANGAGEVHTVVTIPASTEPGAHRLVLTGATGATGSSPLRVHVRAALASTGTSSSTTGGIAGALLLAGLALVVFRRASRPE